MMSAEHEQGINPIEYIKNHKCVTDISYLMEILNEKEPRAIKVIGYKFVKED